AKYADACACLGKDREELLTFYDFPAEHWIHLRTTNPIESTFATIRLRHRRTKGSGTRKASLAMMFKLAQAAQKRWQRLHGSEQITLNSGRKAFRGWSCAHAAGRGRASARSQPGHADPRATALASEDPPSTRLCSPALPPRSAAPS